MSGGKFLSIITRQRIGFTSCIPVCTMALKASVSRLEDSRGKEGIGDTFDLRLICGCGGRWRLTLLQPKRALVIPHCIHLFNLSLG